MQTIEAAFELMEWQGEAMPDRQAVRSVFAGREVSYQAFAMRLPEEGLYRFVILCPLQAPAPHLPALGEFLHRINGSLPLGAFELDFERCSVRWVCSVETDGEPLPAPWIGASMQRGLTSFEALWPELLAVAEARLLPADGYLRSQLSMELPGLNAQLEPQGLALQLPGIGDDAELKVLVKGGSAEQVRQPLEMLFGSPLPFAVITA